MSKFFKFKAEVVTGRCPTCEELTMLVMPVMLNN